METTGQVKRPLSRRAALGLILAGGAASIALDTDLLLWFTSRPRAKFFPLYSYAGHQGGVATLAWSPDGTRIASGAKDKTVRVWEATTGNQVLIYKGHSSGITAIAWSPDGSRIASGGTDNAQVWTAS